MEAFTIGAVRSIMVPEKDIIARGTGPVESRSPARVFQRGLIADVCATIDTNIIGLTIGRETINVQDGLLFQKSVDSRIRFQLVECEPRESPIVICSAVSGDHI